ncbi:alpha/beta hydrolase [Roseibium denhamense]|uniref:Pimeloyl-ACP methyl ester carboxylesterase n=1 Tax=Roseibium denhamense TaxID=76305 RepID=A0ABY1NK78_9HYPH|nr:alpha/beta hydrolase [Roseibium denhamense]MTI06828.1 alpha/beta hydrolase [Roseibium denhamense]SMP11708.1 Pimeloyl-ACP methyl ester carboxylesterase [Roseibium denhamense]
MIIAALTILAVVCALYGYTHVRAYQISRNSAPDGSFATLNGTRLHYHFLQSDVADRDTGPVLVFLHGASGNAYDSRLAFESTLKDKFSLLFIDRPGLGFSNRSHADQNTPEGQAKLISALLSELQIHDAIVIGHSLGAAVAAALAMEEPQKVKGVAFLAPATHPWPTEVNWYYRLAATPVVGKIFCWTLTLPVAERVMPRAVENVFKPQPAPGNYVSEIRADLLLVPDVFRSNAFDIANLKASVIAQSEKYRSIGQPALIVTGTADSVVWPSIHSEGLLQDLPDAELLILDTAGHMPHHTHTDAILRELNRLVRRVQDRSAETSERECRPVPGMRLENAH